MTHGKKNEEITRRPDGAYLIESAPNRRQYLIAKTIREAMHVFSSPIAAAITGYRQELDRMLDAQAIYLGPGK